MAIAYFFLSGVCVYYICVCVYTSACGCIGGSVEEVKCHLYHSHGAWDTHNFSARLTANSRNIPVSGHTSGVRHAWICMWS